MKADITINLDAKCKRCGKGGATQNGYCMNCIAKMLKEGKFDHIIKRIKPNLPINSRKVG